MRYWELLETSAGDIADVPNPHVANPYRKGKTSQPKPKKQKPTDNALDMDVSLFGGPLQKR